VVYYSYRNLPEWTEETHRTLFQYSQSSELPKHDEHVLGLTTTSRGSAPSRTRKCSENSLEKLVGYAEVDLHVNCSACFNKITKIIWGCSGECCQCVNKGLAPASYRPILTHSNDPCCSLFSQLWAYRCEQIAGPLHIWHLEEGAGKMCT
jgi:hypothetical protein